MAAGPMAAGPMAAGPMAAGPMAAGPMAAGPDSGRATIGGPMFKSLIRTIRGPSRDPRMEFISRPLPQGLTDEEVVSALARALDRNPDPAALVETLPAALRQLTGREYQVLDRSVQDVTRAFARTMVMIRDGDVGLWPGYAARAYPLLQPGARAEHARQAIIAAAGDGAQEPSPTDPTGKPGWAPPAPLVAESPPEVPLGDADAGAGRLQRVD
ncbi:MAG: hypothetical protein ACRDHD_03705 [Candidatus Limnocylindria bacterium]